MSTAVQRFSREKDARRKVSANFFVREFACKDGSDLILICPEMVRMVQAVRDYFGAPITIVSGYRTVSHNAKVGGKRGSFHTKGMAADMQVEGQTPLQVFRAIENGWVPGVDPNKIGIGRYATFVHIDSRGRKGRW